MNKMDAKNGKKFSEQELETFQNERDIWKNFRVTELIEEGWFIMDAYEQADREWRSKQIMTALCDDGWHIMDAYQRVDKE